MLLRLAAQQHLRRPALSWRSSLERLIIQLQPPLAIERTVCTGVDDGPRWPWAAAPPQELRCQQEPLAQQVELGAPEHLALEHLQAVDVAFDWAIAPRQPEAGFDGLIIRAEPHRK